MHGNRRDRVVDLALVHKKLDGIGGDTAQNANHKGLPWLHPRAWPCDCNEPGQGAVDRAAQIEKVALDDHGEEQTHHAAGASRNRGRCRCRECKLVLVAVDAARGARVEGIPADPEHDCAKHNVAGRADWRIVLDCALNENVLALGCESSGHLFAQLMGLPFGLGAAAGFKAFFDCNELRDHLGLVAKAPNARPQEDCSAQRHEAAEQMHGSVAGKVAHAQLVQPAVAVPDPVGDHGICESAHPHGQQTVCEQIGALGHCTALNCCGCRSKAELEVEDAVLERVARVIVHSSQRKHGRSKQPVERVAKAKRPACQVERHATECCAHKVLEENVDCCARTHKARLNHRKSVLHR
eukprot:comp21196_c0_seq1/m.45093 comp21196_c0_seq1/g.45093  ORF comp21196_c0_seq1/g.45093 comp21196_c0_seq1/m.45093 type:complete len:353 (-) comp21196_c0_seq1:182-1240(-)